METINLGAVELRTKNQITVPSEVIDFLKLSIGELLIFEQKDDEIIICKAVIKKTGKGLGKNGSGKKTT